MMFRTNEGELIKLSENWINDFNISIINCGGKHELWKYGEILSELGIKFITTADFDFLREGLSQYFTHLKFDANQINALNALKSKIASKIPTSKYKTIAQITDGGLIQEVGNYLLGLQDSGIFIFSGELEHFYKIVPANEKEGGVIETLGKLIEQDSVLSDFLVIDEYYAMFEKFVFLTHGFIVHKDVEVEEAKS